MPDERCFKEEDGSEKISFQWGCKLEVLCFMPVWIFRLWWKWLAGIYLIPIRHLSIPVLLVNSSRAVKETFTSSECQFSLIRSRNSHRNIPMQWCDPILSSETSFFHGQWGRNKSENTAPALISEENVLLFHFVLQRSPELAIYQKNQNDI